jgi:glutamyl-tRNA synthetase
MLIEHFSAERILRAGAIFDIEKLLWMNGVYIRQLSVDDLVERMHPFLEKDLPPEAGPVDKEYLRRLAPLIQERIRTLGGGIDRPGSAAEMTSYFFLDNVEPTPDQLLERLREPEAALNALHRTVQVLGEIEHFEHSILEGALRSAAQELGLSASRYFGMLRIAFTGRTASPPLFETMELLGKDRCLGRIHRAAGIVLSAGQAGPAQA